jgi:NAD/NADP transhydrogenase beta subunit
MLAAAWLALELLVVRTSGSPDSGVIVLGLAAYLGWTIWAAQRPFNNRIIVSGVIVSSAVAIAFLLAGLSIRATLASWLSLVLGIPWSRSWSNWF